MNSELMARMGELAVTATPGQGLVALGGASMFSTGGATLEVGRRNETAVREALVRARIKVVATATGGKRGRTVRVDPAAGVVTVREAGAADVQLHPAVSTSPRQLLEVA